ncbi:sugar phosphate isomerase/epimerase family protein [Rhizobium leguminosarum]
MFHTHSYLNTVGGVVWDIWSIMRDFDPRLIGLNFDIGHVMAKSGAGWVEAAKITRSHVHALSTKDFLWARHEDAEPGQWPWYTRFVQPGRGMVNFLDFFRFFRETGFNGPIIPYYEYMVDVPGSMTPVNLNGRPYGQWTLEIPEDQFRRYLKRDVDFYKQLLLEAGY